VKNFISFTGGDASEATAITFLERYKWNLEAAVDQFFENPPPPEPGPKVDTNAVLSYFNAYKGTGEDETAMKGENLMRFFKELGVVRDDDIVTLAFAWKCKSKNIGTITRDEFLEGMKALKVSGKAALSTAIVRLRNELGTENTFKDFYAFLFEYAKGDNAHKKVIELDFAVALWELTLKDKFAHYDKWLQFVKEEYKKPISRDSWCLLYEFSKIDATKYDASEAWPVIIDEFVEYMHTSSRSK